MESNADDWSPADNLCAIAVSEAQWWTSAVRLSAARLDDAKDVRASPVSSQQLDARFLILALPQLLAAESLAQTALSKLPANLAVADTLAGARSDFLEAVPGVQEMRNALIHFEDWARGEGRGAQRVRTSSGEHPSHVARAFWDFGYDPTTKVVRLGPHRLNVRQCVVAADALKTAIYIAAWQADASRASDVGATAE